MKLKPPPGRKRVYEWTGLRVRTLVPMTTSVLVIPAGMEATVRSAGGGTGLHIQCDPCDCCGVSAQAHHVSDIDVEVIG